MAKYLSNVRVYDYRGLRAGKGLKNYGDSCHFYQFMPELKFIEKRTEQEVCPYLNTHKLIDSRIYDGSLEEELELTTHILRTVFGGKCPFGGILPGEFAYDYEKSGFLSFTVSIEPTCATDIIVYGLKTNRFERTEAHRFAQNNGFVLIHFEGTDSDAVVLPADYVAETLFNKKVRVFLNELSKNFNSNVQLCDK